MIKVYSDEIYLLTDISNWYIEYLDTGINNMSFDISTKHPLYCLLREEQRIEYDNLFYSIKTINERTKSDIATITADLDLNDLKAVLYTSYKTEKKSFEYVVNDVLSNTGWQVLNAATVTGLRSLDLQDVTPLDILEYCTNSTVYNRKFKYDNKNKTITAINVIDIKPSGAYFTDELNLQDVNFKGSSETLVTRLYAYGKDGMTIKKYAGREWIENHDYTDKVIAAVWRDERYTDERSLYDDAVDKLKELSKPARSYTCTVLDLAAQSEEYNFLSIKLYDVVTLIDRNRKARVNHRVVSYKKYPLAPENNAVTLSSVTDKITSKITKLQADLNTQKIIQRQQWNDIRRDVDQNSANIGQLFIDGEDNVKSLSNLIAQTAESTISEIRRTQSIGTENYVLNPSPFTSLDHIKTYGGDTWELSIDDSYLKLSQNGTNSELYLLAELRKPIVQGIKKQNYYSSYFRIKASAPCRIYLAYEYETGEGSVRSHTIISPKNIRASNTNKKSYFDITEADAWCDVYAEVQNTTMQMCNVTYVGLLIRNDANTVPADIDIYIDSIQAVSTPCYEERLTTVEQTADGLKTTVALKADYSDFETYKTDVEQTFNSISLTASNNTRSSNLTVAIKGVEIAAAEIKLTGMVAFEDLSTAGRSTIIGDNITTGTISSVNKKCKIKLASSTIEFATTYSNGITGLFELSPSGLYFKDVDGAIQGSFYPVADQNRTYLLTHRVSIAGTKNSGKSVETSLEAEYGSNGVPTGNLRLIGGSINESFILSNIGILRVNGINFDCRRGKVNLSAAIDTPGLTIDGITYTARYLQSEGIYVLGATS